MVENLNVYPRSLVNESKKLNKKPSVSQPWLKYYTQYNQDYKIPEKSIYQCIYDNNRHHLNRIAIEYYGRKITFGELFEQINKTTASFKANGIEKGDIVTLCMPTTPETIYIFYALSRLGAISNMIDPRTSAEGIKEYIKEVDSKIVVVMDLFYEKVESIREDTNIQKTITISAKDSLPLGMNFAYSLKEMMMYLIGSQKKVPSNQFNTKWNDFIKEGSKDFYGFDIPYEKNRAVAIVHTGGTTGTPKGVMLSNDSFNAIAYQYKLSGMHLLPGHKFLNIMPPFIAYGSGCGIHMPLVIGMTTVPIPAFNPKDFAKTLLKVKPQHLAVVPSMYSNLFMDEKIKNKDLSFWITPAAGGDGMNVKLEQETNQFLQEHNCVNNVIKGYGITEECSLATACINEHNKVGSVGIPLPKNVVSIFNPDSEEELNFNEEGEVCINCLSMMLGYYNNQEETDKIIRTHKDGTKWIHTQDLGYMDEDGFLFISGRIKRVIIRYDGFKVFPFLIEKCILSHKAVKECIVVGIPDTTQAQGKVPVAHIVLKNHDIENVEKIKEEIKELCTVELPEYVLPVDYKIKESLPLTSIGKIDYRKLEEEEKQKVMIKQ